jgi:hypothetical protein
MIRGMLSPSLGRCCAGCAGALRLRLRRRLQLSIRGRRRNCSRHGASLILPARLRVHARWMRLQREANAAASILVHGSLQIHFLHLQRAWRSIIHRVVQPAALQPIVSHDPSNPGQPQPKSKKGPKPKPHPKHPNPPRNLPPRPKPPRNPPIESPRTKSSLS